MSNATSTPAAASVTCPKCMGSRKFRTYSPYTGKLTFEGPCFACKGTGTMDASKVENSPAAKQRTSLLLYTVESIVNEAAARGDMERAESYMGRMVPEMFTVGTRNARTILDALAGGRWFHDAEGTRGKLDPEIGAQLRARCIELGREIAAAK